MRQEIFDGKSWHSPPPPPDPLIQTFSIPESNERLKGSPTAFFGTVRQKKIRRKILILPPPLLIHKLIRYQKFSETQHRRVPLRKVSVLWDKKFSTENRDKTLWSIRLFDTRNQWHPKGFPYEICRHCETKNFRQKIVILPSSSPSSLLSINFFDTRNFVKHRRVPLRSFSVLWDKTILTENRDTRPLSYP